jgi:hypothetical protein
VRSHQPPRPFLLAARKRSLWALAALTLIAGAAMLPALATMTAHGASLIAFELAGSVSRSGEIVSEWGAAGRDAMWWQLALDTPFLIGYGLFLAGACTAVAGRARRAGRPRLRRAATIVAWFGPIAAAADLLQNVSLALILAGHEAQPWPRISALGGYLTNVLITIGLAFALCGAVATRRAVRPSLAESPR